jgi:hypothetical protein
VTEFSDLESSGDEKIKTSTNRARSHSKNRIKECPGCGAQLAAAIKECTYCDYTFTSKSMLVGAQSALDESRSIRNRFPFEPERVSSLILRSLPPPPHSLPHLPLSQEEDGTLKIQFIFGRKLRKNHHKRVVTLNSKIAHRSSAVESKFDFDYLVKYKTMSYLHVQWLSAHEIGE